MKSRLCGTLVVSAASVLGLEGCQSCRPCLLSNRTVTAYPPPAPVVIYPAPGTPVPAPVPQPMPQPPPAPPVEARGYQLPSAPVDATWHPPANAGVQLAVPEPPSAEPSRDPIRLYPPETAQLLPPEPPKPGVAEQREQTPGVREERTRPPGSREERTPGAGEERGRPPKTSEEPKRAPSLPVGIPNFAAVSDKVASGLKPSLDGGLDWLQANGYRTVLHVKQPGEDDAADKREVEKRGLKYLSLEVSPQTLSPAIVEQFNRIVGDTAGYPLFVYDKDGMLAGGLWYLHFRTVDRATDEAARTKANRLGLKEEAVGDHKAMWLAIQKLLSDGSR